MKTHPMTNRASHGRRRLTRTAFYTLLSNPHALITVPLAIGLLVSALAGTGGDGVGRGAAGLGGLVACYGCVAGIVLFSMLAAAGVILSVIYAWRTD